MPKAIQILITFTLVAAAAGSALADPPEPPTGSRLGDWRRPGPALTERDQAEGAKAIAKCLYDGQAKIAQAVLLAPSKERADANIKSIWHNVTCYSLVFGNELVAERRIEVPDDILRGMLAEAALEKSHARVVALQALPLQQKRYIRPWFAITGRHPSIDEMGACIADTNPAGVAALISTGPASPEEAAAFGNLTDNLGKCLQAGTRLQASRQALRAALADALFQRVYAPAPPPQTSAEATKK